MFQHQKMFGYINIISSFTSCVIYWRFCLYQQVPTLGCTHFMKMSLPIRHTPQHTLMLSTPGCILHTIAFCSCVLGTCNISLTNPFWSTVLCLQLLQLQTWGILWIILSYLFWDLIRSFGENMDMRRQVVSGYVMCWVSAFHSHFIGLNFGAPYLTRDLLLLYVPPLDIFRK